MGCRRREVVRLPNVLVTRFNQPVEELGIHPDKTFTDLDDLLNFVLGDPPSHKR
jgi:hypothetical protein